MPLIHRPFRRVGVVNRGEPAVRFIRAARTWSHRRREPLEVVAFFTDADREALFVQQADDVVALGPALVPGAGGRPTSAYLDGPRLVRLLLASGCDAVWPGWGFLSENAAFVDACTAAGIVFIGPSGESMRALGDKIAAKQLAERLGLPVTGWSGGPVADAGAARIHADRLGYPVLLKAAAGGGGRGIRLVTGAGELPAAFSSAAAEAAAAFGDPTLLVEAFVPEARHVEVQLLGDSLGNVHAIGTRDCSMQRRHQKLLEEAPAPLLSAALDATLRESAVAIARASGYVSAGTAEFLVLPDGGCAFLELNTRLQVEHPVTECVTGLDLVGAQIDIARGERVDPGPLSARGHAIEARLCAEDPDDRFTPSAGRLIRFDAPHGPGIRVDSGFAAGATIPGEFDSLLAKVIVTGATREEALARLQEALSRFTVAIEGGASNRSLLLELVRHDAFQAGPVTTRWLDRWLQERPGGASRRHLDAALTAAAVSEYVGNRRGDVLNFIKDAQRGLPSKIPPPEPQTFRFRVGGRAVVLEVAATGPRLYRVTSEGRAIEVRLEFTGPSTAVLTYRGRRHDIVRVVTPTTVHVEVDGVAHGLVRASDGRVVAPVPAAVTHVHVRSGSTVKAGDRLVTLEVMKMEIGVDAPLSGRVTEVFVDAASRVAAGDALLSIQAEPSATEAATPARALSPFADVPESQPADTPARPENQLRGAVLGYDVEPAEVERAVSEVRAGRSVPARSALFGLIDGYVARESLFDGAPGPDGVAAVDHFASFLRLPRARGDGLPDDFLAKLRRALAFYGVHDLVPGPVLESALLRLCQAHKARDGRDSVLLTVLAALERDADSEAGADEAATMRDLLESFAILAAPRNRRLAESAWLALYVLCDRPRQLAEARALTAGALEALSTLAAAGPRGDDAAAATLDELPMGALLAAVEPWLTDPGRNPLILLDLLVTRLHRSATRERTVEGAPAAWYWTAKGAPLLAVLAPADDAWAATRRALEEGRPGTADDAEIDVFLPPPSPETVAKLESLEGAALPGSGVGRASLLWGDVELGRLGRTFRRTGGAWAEDTFFRDFHPARAEATELLRFSAFELERVPSTGELFLATARARQDPSDERLACLVEVERLDLELDPATGGVKRSPGFERVYMAALYAMREALASRGHERRWVWNRLVVFLRPVLTISRAELEQMARRLAAPTIGLALDKVVVRARIPGPSGELRPVAIEWSNPTGAGVAVTIVEPPKTVPLRVLSAYERRVVESRRRGLFYPYELIRALAGREQDAQFPPGTFRELDLSDDGARLVPVSRPFGHNVANLVVGLLENRFAPFDDGLKRVLIVGDPTKSMGSLAEPECRRVLAAFDLADAEGLPVEWVPISSGAKIALDSGTENLDWTARVLARIVRFTQAGGVVNVLVDGVCVGAQSYWNAEATMLMHCRGTLIMTRQGSMLLTGKRALEFAGSVAAEDNLGIGGYERIMGPNGQAQYFAPDLVSAYQLLFRHYRLTHVQPGEHAPRRLATADPPLRDPTLTAYTDGPEAFATVGDIFDEAQNPGRKRPFGIRSVMRAVLDQDVEPLERWAGWHGAESAVVYESALAGAPVTCIGIESRPVRRKGELRADGPDTWTSGTLFPQSSKKVARALGVASGVRPAVVLANLSGFDGSPDSLRNLQLEYGAEIGRAVVNFRGPLIFCVVARYHGGAYVVFSRALNPNLEAVALEGSFASVIGGAPAAAVVFPNLVRQRAAADPRVVAAKAAMERGSPARRAAAAALHEQALREASAAAQAQVAREFDAIHCVQRARDVGSLDAIIHPSMLRAWLAERLGAWEQAVAAAPGLVGER